MQSGDMVQIEGIVDRVLFRNETNGYIVLDLDTGTALTTVVGELGNIDEGEELLLTGEYITHPKFGAQFKAQICERKMPETAYAIQKYLASGVIKGIGPTLSKRIVAMFGDNTLEVIEHTPEELIKVKGITAKKLEEISQEFRRIFGIRRLMMYLSQFMISPAVAVKVWKKWGQFSIDMIQDNPYLLCDLGIDVEFRKAEQIADELKIPHNSHDRIRAGISYILVQNTYSGHTCLPTDRLEAMACSFMEITPAEFYECLEKEYKEETLVEFIKKNRPFTYLYDYYAAENFIAGRMAVMRTCQRQLTDNLDTVIAFEEDRKGLKYGDLQKKAISVALSQGFMILTGGPGTGKTTTLNAIISLYEQQGLRVMIAAPTGRAAKRISDLTGYDARTIHRLLEVGYDTDGKLRFVHNENNPVQCDVLIIDEMSMVDSLLFEAVLRAIKLSCRLIMVGDSDQLPSVGAGNLLKDLIDSDIISVVKLEEIFRQAQESCIVTNAHKIVHGEMPDLTQKNNDFFFFQRLESTLAVDTVIDLYCQRLPKAYGINPISDIQILSPTRKGTLGTVELNKRLQLEINPPSAELKEVKGLLYTFRENDKVMQTKNNYDILWKREDESGAGIFNGDIGNIISVKRHEGIVIIDFEGRVAEYTLEMLDQLELAYAITVHKSQGSEFTAVILPLLGGFDKLYYRNLLYTAVTRAKKLLIIVGSKNQVEAMVKNDRKTLRYSCLKTMLQKEMNDEET